MVSVCLPSAVLLDAEKYASITLFLKEFKTKQRRIFFRGLAGRRVCRETNIQATFLLSNLEFIWKKRKKKLLGAGAAAAKSLQSCPTLGDPIDGSPPGSPVPGILQARTLEWVAIWGDKSHSNIFPCFSLPALHIFPCVIFFKII